MQHLKENHFDLIIVGAGMVGLSLACALKDSGLSIAIVDRSEPPELHGWQDFDLRVSSITKSSENFLSNIGAWQTIRDQGICPFSSMDVWEQDGTASIQFYASELGERHLGNIVENRVIQASLADVLQNSKSQTKGLTWFCPESISTIDKIDEKTGAEIQQEGDSVLWQVQLSSGKTIGTHLLIGADGANSFVRDQIEVEVEVESLGHHAIVTTIETEQEHDCVARQRFLQTGPLALLPLRNVKSTDSNYQEGGKLEKHCSIVWSLIPEEAEKIMALDEVEFNKLLGQKTEFRLGEILASDKRVSFPLLQRHAKSYLTTGAVLVGDAAHTIHPLAGQGVNLGFMDAAVLVEEIKRAQRRGIDIFGREVLRRYERRRRGQNTLMMKTMTGFRDLFAANNADIRAVRNTGLRWVNDLPFIKQHIVSRAMGLDGDLPDLARATLD